MMSVKEAILEIESMGKGYGVCHMVYDPNEYELYKDENVLIDHLSEAQVIAMVEILKLNN